MRYIVGTGIKEMDRCLKQAVRKAVERERHGFNTTFEKRITRTWTLTA